MYVMHMFDELILITAVAYLAVLPLAYLDLKVFDDHVLLSSD